MLGWAFSHIEIIGLMGASAIAAATSYGWALAVVELTDARRSFCKASAMYRDALSIRDAALSKKEIEAALLRLEIDAYRDAQRLRRAQLSAWGKAGRAKQIANRSAAA